MWWRWRRERERDRGFFRPGHYGVDNRRRSIPPEAKSWDGLCDVSLLLLFITLYFTFPRAAGERCCEEPPSYCMRLGS